MMKKMIAVLMACLLLLSTAQAGMYTGTALPDKKSTKCAHVWHLVSVERDATCAKEGRGQFKCTKCGKTASRKISRIAHVIGEWTVERESTCTKEGKWSAKCLVCGKTVTVKVPKARHTVAEWKIVRNPTDKKAGVRKGKCSVCGKNVKETLYPEGTLYLYDAAYLIIELQTELTRLGLFTGEITGVYDSNTIKAVKKFQKQHKLKVDGICWPSTLAVLGVNLDPGTPIREKNLKGYKLQLEVEMISEPQSVYHPGDTILFRWTVTNAGKSDAKGGKLNLYDTVKPSAETDTVLEELDLLQRKGSLTGTWTYTVTAGQERFGFVVRADLKGKTYESNTVSFKLKVEGSGTAAAPSAETAGDAQETDAPDDEDASGESDDFADDTDSFPAEDDADDGDFFADDEGMED